MKKNQIVSSFFAILTYALTTGCSTPGVQYSGKQIDDGGVHMYSQTADERRLIYNKRALAATSREEQKMDMGRLTSERAIEHLGNLKEGANQNGLTQAERERILEAKFWNKVDKKPTYTSSSGGYYYSGGIQSFGGSGTISVSSGNTEYSGGAIYPTGKPFQASGGAIYP